MEAINPFESAAQFCLTFITLVAALEIPLILTVAIRIEEKFQTEIFSKRLYQNKGVQAFIGLIVFASLIIIPIYFSNINSPNGFLENSRYALLFFFTFLIFGHGSYVVWLLIDYLNSEKLFSVLARQQSIKEYLPIFSNLAKRYDDHKLMDLIIKNIKEKVIQYRNQGKDFFHETHRELPIIFQDVYQEKNSLYYYHSLTVSENIINSENPTEYSQGEWIYLWNILWICIENDLDDTTLTIWDQLHGKFGRFHFDEDGSGREKEVNDRFVKFAIMLLSLLWKKEKYGVIKRILKYSLSSWREHELLPNYQSSIFKILIDLTNIITFDNFILNLRFPEDEGLNWVEKGIHVEIFLRVYMFHMYEHFRSGCEGDRFDYFNFKPQSEYDKNFLILFLERAIKDFEEKKHLKIIDKFFFTDQNYLQLEISSPSALFKIMIEHFKKLSV